jgi:small subunit ribosomal protein S1
MRQLIRSVREGTAKSAAGTAGDSPHALREMPSPQEDALIVPEAAESARSSNTAAKKSSRGRPARSGRRQTDPGPGTSASDESAKENLAPQAAAPRVALPRSREGLSPDLEAQLRDALGEGSIENLLESHAPDEADVTVHGQIKGTVVAVRGDDVFVDLGGRNQGVVPVSQFEAPPAVGDAVEATVHAERPEDGLFDLALAGAVVDVSDWSEVAEGMVVEGLVTGHNKGGLDVRVGGLRGFMPASQVGLFRTDDLAQFVDQKFSCLVVEADPRRRKLVLSRRAVLEREQAEAKQKLWDSLAVGQIHEGVVRSLQNFGAFVDLGGADGLIHISQLSWDRVGHAGEVLTLGQKVRVRIEKVDPVNRRIGLSYRDLFESPWVGAAKRYPVNGRVVGTVTKLMDIGALVRLEPGVSGLVHISELSHKRVHRVKDVLTEGDQVEAVVLSVDETAQRISLSIKALQSRVDLAEPEQEDVGDGSGRASSSPPVDRSRRDAGLRGGLDRASGGQRFGLKW